MKIYDMENHFYAKPVLEFMAGRTDYPYVNLNNAIDFAKGLPLSKEDKDKILGGNAEKYILKL